MGNQKNKKKATQQTKAQSKKSSGPALALPESSQSAPPPRPKPKPAYKVAKGNEQKDSKEAEVDKVDVDQQQLIEAAKALSSMRKGPVSKTEFNPTSHLDISDNSEVEIMVTKLNTKKRNKTML